MKYKVPEEKRQLYAGIYLLEYLINGKGSISTLLEGNDQDLESLLEWLQARAYIDIADGLYIATEKGREVLSLFMQRYSEFLHVFDVYCAVDLEKGEFAFSNYYQYDNETGWNSYLNQKHWEDLRIAVAELKGIDPVEIVFMSYINEGRFGRDGTGWQFDLLLGSVWDQITEICETALKVADLSFEDEQGRVSGQDVLCDVIAQGTELMQELHKQENEYNKQHQHDNDDDSFGQNSDDDDTEEVVVVTEYYDDYDPYYDPFYISPVWVCLLLL